MTFICPLSEGSAGPRVAVKDLIDWAGTPTTAGSRAVPVVAATTDAACLAGLRAAVDAGTARVVGKAGLHELGMGTTGVNPWFGTPPNPWAPDRVPGGSSSGSAAAVASGDADWAVGTDTAGSVRIPAACCGVVGFVPSRGVLPLQGVWPVAPTLDRVGVLAPSVGALTAALAVLGVHTVGAAPRRIGRLRPPLPTDPAVDAAIDAFLATLGLPVVDVDVPDWLAAVAAGTSVIGAEVWAHHGGLVRSRGDAVGDDVRRAFAHAATIGRQRLRDARARCDRFAASCARTFAVHGVDVLALPTLGLGVPTLASGASPEVGFTLPGSVAGLPALSVPVAAGVSVQVLGPPGGDDAVLAVLR